MASTYVFRSPLNDKVCAPDKPLMCTWVKNADKDSSPHTTQDWKRTTPKLAPNALATIGHTPMIKLNKIPQSAGLKCDVYVKCEFFNPGGSVKDRMALRIVEDAEKQGILKPGSTIIEPSSGNTGVGLAMVAAIKGYRCIICIAEKISLEKEYVMRALGAEVVRTPSSANSFSPDGMFGMVHRLSKQIPNAVIFDQFSNPGNPLTHYDTTSEEIYEECDGQVAMIVMGAGTGGTVCGIGRKFKEISPSTKIVCADPYGSIFAQPEDLNKTDVTFWEVEGMGYEFIPTVLDRSVVDQWIKVPDSEALPMARRLIKEEGLLVGASSGAMMVAALKAAKDLPAGHKVVVILPDGIRNYLTKFVCDQWMEARGLAPAVNTNNHWWWDLNVCSLKLAPLQTTTMDATYERVLSMLKKGGVDQIPALGPNGGVVGVVTMQNIVNKVISGNLQANDSVDRCIDRLYPKVLKSANLGLVSRVLEKEPYVMILDVEGTGPSKINRPVGIVTAIDLLDFIQKKA
ncbi:cystathionine beta-synthase [Leptinotarsa decemlineata]|uniref:cystathionine beta-synthase n=1 Tax=Leptinotarsa decemlineata TaxID=7539 RepID=UPI003D3075A5